jgi:hypothetical protein
MRSYSTLFLSIDGLSLWVEYFLWDVISVFGITLSNRYSYTLCNHSCYKVNK